MSGRGGTVSIHYEVTSLAKGGELAEALDRPRTAAEIRATSGTHQRYLERPGVAERVTIIGAVYGQSYLNVDGKAEVTDLMKLSSFGTIPSGPEHRSSFWSTVEAHESNPTHTVYFDRADDRKTVFEKALGLIEDAELPEQVRAAVRDGKTIRVSTDTALALVSLFHAAGQQDGFRHRPGATRRRPLRIKPGRGGTVQIRMIASLPYELTAEQRLALAKEYCAQFDKQGLAYWAVIHAPGAANDDRNYHLHVVLYDRPCKLIQRDGREVWDFAHKEPEYDPKQRRVRMVRRQRKDKIRSYAQNTMPWTERVRFAKLTNEHLVRAGLSKRVTPHSHADMGVATPAREKLTQGDYNRERRGEATVAGARMAARQWDEYILAVTRRQEREQADAGQLGSAYSEKFRTLQDMGVSAHESMLGSMLGDVIAQRGYSETVDRDAHVLVAQRLGSRVRLLPEAKRSTRTDAVQEVAEELLEAAKEHERERERFAGRFTAHEVHLDRQIEVARLEAKRAKAAAEIAAREELFEAQQTARVASEQRPLPVQTAATAQNANTPARANRLASVPMPHSRVADRDEQPEHAKTAGTIPATQRGEQATVRVASASTTQNVLLLNGSPETPLQPETDASASKLRAEVLRRERRVDVGFTPETITTNEGARGSTAPAAAARGEAAQHNGVQEHGPKGKAAHPAETRQTRAADPVGTEPTASGVIGSAKISRPPPLEGRSNLQRLSMPGTVARPAQTTAAISTGAVPQSQAPPLRSTVNHPGSAREDRSIGDLPRAPITTAALGLGRSDHPPAAERSSSSILSDAAAGARSNATNAHAALETGRESSRPPQTAGRKPPPCSTPNRHPNVANVLHTFTYGQDANQKQGKGR